MPEREPPRLDAAAIAAINDALRRGVDVEVHRGPEGRVIVFELTKKIKYRTP